MKNFVIFALLASLVQVARFETFTVDPVNGPYFTILSAIIANGGDPTLDLILTAGVHNMSAGIELTEGPTDRFSMVGAGAENTIITRAAPGTRAFFIRGVDEIFISGVTFTGCVDTASETTSRGGGAMFLNVQGNITIENSVFNNNRGRKGGAISLAPFGGNGPTYIRNVTFVDNTTPWGGGAVFASGVDVFFENCHFVGNTAGGEGGAVQVYWEEAGSDFSYSFVNSVFANNTGVDCGGAISTYSAVFGQINLELEGCLFENNVINGVSFASGGAVCMQNAGNFVSYSSTFTGNSVFPGEVTYSFGGAIWLYNNGNQGSTTILSSKFSNNYARIAAGLMLSNRFSALHTQTSLILNSEFSGNVANLGSVITLVYTTVSISQTTIQHNQIPADNFALSVEEQSSIYLNNTVITNTTNAGGVFCASSTVELFRSSIYGNGDSKDISCSSCTWEGLDFNPCSETCTTRDICSMCNGNVTCIGDCTTNSIPWSSTPCVTTTGESTTEAVDSSSSLLLSTLLIGIIAGLLVILAV